MTAVKWKKLDYRRQESEDERFIILVTPQSSHEVRHVEVYDHTLPCNKWYGTCLLDGTGWPLSFDTVREAKIHVNKMIENGA